MTLGNVDIRNVEADAETTDIDYRENQLQAQIEADTTLDQTERQALIKARKGQGIFRYNLEQIERCCRVTGLEDERLLIASHVKPWRRCETNRERLDGSNGLLLAPHIDRLFDRGLITFERDGQMLVSSTVVRKTVECLRLPDARTLNVGTFSDHQEFYLAYHRNNLFLP